MELERWVLESYFYQICLVSVIYCSPRISVWSNLEFFGFASFCTLLNSSCILNLSKGQLKNLETCPFFFASVARHSPVFIKCVKLSFFASIASNYFQKLFHETQLKYFCFFSGNTPTTDSVMSC